MLINKDGTATIDLEEVLVIREVFTNMSINDRVRFGLLMIVDDPDEGPVDIIDEQGSNEVANIMLNTILAWLPTADAAVYEAQQDGG